MGGQVDACLQLFSIIAISVRQTANDEPFNVCTRLFIFKTYFCTSCLEFSSVCFFVLLSKLYLIAKAERGEDKYILKIIESKMS